MALSPQQRSKNYRQRMKEAGNKTVLRTTVSTSVVSILDEYIGIAGNNRAEVVENAITTWACDAAEALPQLRELLINRKEEIKK